jgi:hypothetical protein
MSRHWQSLFDQLGGLREQAARQAKRLGGSQIDHQLKLAQQLEFVVNSDRLSFHTAKTLWRYEELIQGMGDDEMILRTPARSRFFCEHKQQRQSDEDAERVA